MNTKDLARAIVDELPRLGSPLQLTPQQLALLVLLDGVNEGMSVREVRAALGLSVATASELVNASEAAGLVETLSTFNHRVHLVVLTAKGKRLRHLRRGGKPPERSAT